MPHTIKRLIPLLILLTWSTAVLAMSKQEDLPSDEFARRRAIFMEELRELNACAIFHSASLHMRNKDVEYPYRQDSDFFYLTGWPYHDGVLVLTPRDDPEKQSQVTFFVSPRDPKVEIWTGPKWGVDEALVLPGIDQAYAYAAFNEHLSKLLAGYERLVVSYGGNDQFEEDLQEQLKQAYGHPSIVQEASSLLKAHRLIKSDAEIAALQKAVDITQASLVDALPQIPTFEFEYEAKALIEYGFAKRGSERLGFPSIVGTGRNATILHYEGSHGAMKPGDLLLMDVGAEWKHYSADISRTVPVSGVFTPEQAALYQLVLDAQLAAIEAVQPGVSWRKPHETAVEVITAGLVELGLLQGEVTALIQDRSYRQFFKHGTSHWLGLDVHDAGGYLAGDGAPHKMKAGMVLTIEPGIYISESDEVDPKWWNIGIRIEDDVLVTPKGHRVLSQSIPKTITEIETLMRP